MELREKATQGVFWAFVEKWGTQLTSFVVFLILARLLDPGSFGLVSMAMVVVGFLQVFLDQGLSEVVIQKKDLTSEHLDTAFWANIATGISLMFICILLSGATARFYREPELSVVIKILSFTFVFVSLSSTQQAILKRSLDFKGLALRTVVARLCGGAVGIVMAILGNGVWSLVGQSLVNGFVGIFMLWRVNEWRPGFRVRWDYLKEMLGFGINILGVKIINYFNISFDNLLIGYFLGKEPLGYYTVAHNLMIKVYILLSGVILSVFFPTFSRMQDDLPRLRNAFLKTLRFTGYIVIPMFLGMFTLASELVTVLFDVKWLPSVPTLRILAITGIFMALLSFTGQVLLAIGESKQFFWLKTLGGMIRIVSFFIAVNWGILAIAVANLVAHALVVPIHIITIRRHIGIKANKYLSQFIAPLLGTLLMMSVIFVLKRYLNPPLKLYFKLLAYVFIGGGIYVMFVQIYRPDVILQFLDVISLILPAKWRFCKAKKENN